MKRLLEAYPVKQTNANFSAHKPRVRKTIFFNDFNCEKREW